MNRKEWRVAKWIRGGWEGDGFSRFMTLFCVACVGLGIWGTYLLVGLWLVPGPFEMSAEQRLDIRFRREFYQCRKVHGSWNYGYQGDTRVWWCGDSRQLGGL